MPVSPQSPGTTQTVQGAVGGENQCLARGAHSDAKVSEGWELLHCKKRLCNFSEEK